MNKPCISYTLQSLSIWDHAQEHLYIQVVFIFNNSISNNIFTMHQRHFLLLLQLLRKIPTKHTIYSHNRLQIYINKSSPCCSTREKLQLKD